MWPSALRIETPNDTLSALIVLFRDGPMIGFALVSLVGFCQVLKRRAGGPL